MNIQTYEELMIDVKFKVADVLRYNMSVALKSIANKLALLIGGILFGFFIYKLFNRDIPLDLFIVQNIMLIVIPGIIFIMIPWRTWQVTLAQMQLPAFAFGVTYTFSQHKITLDVGESKEEMPWDLFIQIKETKNDFRFFVDTVRAQLIPKHNFSKEELGVFKRIAAQATEKEVCKFK
jgi:hypothetical protein